MTSASRLGLCPDRVALPRLKQVGMESQPTTKKLASGTAVAKQMTKHSRRNVIFKMATSSSETNKSIFAAQAAETVIGGLSADILDDAHEDAELHERIVSQLRDNGVPVFQTLQIDVQDGEVSEIGRAHV